jgi:TonB family protein
MASILVVGQEQRSLERFHRVLSAEGWRVRVAQGRAQALQAAALEPPDLVLAGADIPGAEELASAFRRSAGGPGIVVVMGEGGSPTGPAVLGDDRLRQPFGDQDLVAAVRRMLAARRDTGGQASTAPLPQTVRLTSQEIFGDVLAEVEGQFTAASPAGISAPAAGRSGGSPQAPLTQASPAPPAAAAAQPSRASSRDDDVQRKLEKTLSGLMGGDPRRTAASPGAPSSAAPAQGSRRADPNAGAAGIEALLSKTLSELGARPRPSSAAAGASAPAPAAARPPAQASPRATPATPVITAPAASPAAASKPTPAASPMTAAAVAAAAPAAQAPPAASAAPAASPAPAAASAAARSEAVSSAPPARPASPSPQAPLAQAPPAAPPPPPSAPAATAPSPGSPPAADSTGVRRRMTGELDLSQIEEMARTRRKVDPSSRPGLASPSAAAAAPRTGSSPLPPTPPMPLNVGLPGARLGGDSPAATQRIQMVPREARETPEPAGEKFGQYTLLERIAVGGMAEVWKARMRGVEGFQKTVAIKKILPYMTDNADFVAMFIDEAKLAAQLSHPNIIHIYDLGKIGSDFYIAMEYVEGKDLRSLLNAARQQSLPLPLGLALLIGVRVASGLAYAHRKRDFEGREMALVHRDVSPQNVLISYDGDVKLCDFGIAKAVSKAGETQMGALKGKLQYMSPEQARGNMVDARSDLFSLGTVLFEMLTGQRLFEGDSEMSVLEAVRQVKVRPPRQVDPTIPQEVDDVVMHALAGRPQDRFQTAGELEQRLETLLYSLKPSPSHSDLAAYVRRVLEPPVAGARADRTPAAAGETPGLGGAGERLQPPRPAAPAPAVPPLASVPAAVAAAAMPAISSLPSGPASAANRLPAMPFAPPPPPPRVATAPAAAAPAAAQFPPQASPPQASAAPSGAPPDVAPLAPLGEVRMEEGSRPSRMLLAAVAAGLVLAALVTYFVLGRRNAANPGGAAAVPGAAGTSAAAVPGAKAAGGPAAAAAGAAGAAGVAGQHPPPGAAGAAGAQPASGKVDVQGVVDQEVARRADELKKKLEEQQKQLQKEIDKNKTAKPDTANAATANPSASAAGSVPPAGTGPEAAAARGQQKPAATPGTEPRATPEASAGAAGTVPASAASSAAPQDAARARAAEPAARPPGETTGTGAASRGAAAQTGASGATRGGSTVPPKLVSTPKPEYPPLARKLGVQGVVVLSVLVDEEGRVEDVQVLERIGQDVGINEAAVQVARGAHFKSATRDGVPVKMWTRLRIPFKL